jgi:MFS family permease
MLELLRHNRNVALVVTARFLARMGGEAAFFIGVWGMAAYRFQATPGELAAVMGTLAATSMIGAAISGLLIDRYGPRNVLLGAQFVYAPTAIAMTMTTSLPQLVAGCVVFGLSVAPIMTATSSFAPYLTDNPDEFVTLNSLLEGVGALSFVVGPAIGAVMAKTISIQSVFWLDAAMTLIGAALVLPVHTPPVAKPVETKHPLRELTDGFRIAYGIRSVRYYVLMGTVVWMSFGAFGALEPLFYRDVVKTGVETIGWVNSIFGAGIGLGALALTRLPARTTSAKGLAIGVAFVGLGAIVYVGTTDLVIIAVGAFVWGAVIGGIEPMLRTLMQVDSPEEYLGRIMGTAQIHRNAGELVPLALAPALAAAFGVQAVLIGGGILAAIIALATLPIAASIDRSRTPLVARITVVQALPEDEPISPIT